MDYMMPQKGDCARIAFFGGSFDPPHRGHLAIARAAQVALHLNTVLFAPVGSQPLKPHGSTASFADRLAMTELAIQGQPGFEISLADAPSFKGSLNPKPNYTIDTLLRLRAPYPKGTVFFCLMGADSFLGLRHWHRGSEIPFAAPLIVASRPGQRLADLSAILPPGLSIHAESSASGQVEMQTFTLSNAAGATAPFYLLPGLEVEISASEIRRQARATLRHLCAGHDLLPDAVCEYISAHSLYR
jgi:nicotinate-nucleotide adenylyltransferase